MELRKKEGGGWGCRCTFLSRGVTQRACVRLHWDVTSFDFYHKYTQGRREGREGRREGGWRELTHHVLTEIEEEKENK